MEPQQLTLLDRIALRWRWLLAGSILLLVLYALLSFSLLGVEASGGNASQDMTYTILNQATGQISSGKYTDSFTKIVRKGSYEVTVKQTSNHANGFVITKTKGFFLKTIASVQINPVPSRQFVGDGPGGCMYYVSGTLYSYGCQGSQTLTTHVPATSSQPTYNLNTQKYGNIRGVVSTSQGTLALVQNSAGEDNAEPYNLLVLGDRGSIARRVTINLDTNKTYEIAPYKDGYLIYSGDFTDVTYFNSVGGTGQKIKVNAPGDTKQKAFKLSASSNSIAAVYSNKADTESNTASKNVGDVKATAELISGTNSTSLKVNRQLSEVLPCGSSKLCALDSNKNELVVYELDGDNLSQLYIMRGVNSIASHGKNVLAGKAGQLYSLNVDNQNGTIVYDSPEYNVCGVNDISSTDYLVCIANKDGGKASVLRIDTAAKADDFIDEKLVQLKAVPEIRDVSVYKQSVFIAPNLGEVVYVDTLQDFDYDPAVRASARRSIQEAIKKIDLKGYNVTINGL